MPKVGAPSFDSGQARGLLTTVDEAASVHIEIVSQKREWGALIGPAFFRQRDTRVGRRMRRVRPVRGFLLWGGVIDDIFLLLWRKFVAGEDIRMVRCVGFRDFEGNSLHNSTFPCASQGVEP